MSVRSRPVVAFTLALLPALAPGSDAGLATFRREIQPVLEKYCFDCHGAGVDKGGVTLDAFQNDADLHDPKLWIRALKNVRAGLMPPADEEPLPAAAAAKLQAWIKQGALGLSPGAPDPGRVTVRRLNRVEYRNTIRDLTGVDYDTQKEFPADDTGQGFDTIADVLTISPLLLEKYLDAAQSVVGQFVPTRARVVAEHVVPGRAFVTATPAATTQTSQRRGGGGSESEGLDLSYYTPAVANATYSAPHAGKYQLVLELRSIERYVEDQFDQNKARFVFRVDGEQVFAQEFMREGGRKLEFAFDREWPAGEHPLQIEVTPLTPDLPQIRSLRFRVVGVTVRGPFAPEHWVKPKDYARVFPREVPAGAPAQRAYRRELLEKFAARAFRRPPEPASLDGLVQLAETVSAQAGNTFEAGIAQAMAAVLGSPGFIFREERTVPLRAGQAHPLLDEYSLASRLSYFFWSTTPDEELTRLARDGQLRAQLPAQLKRLLADNRSREFVRNFTGQWLQARDIAHVPITALDVFLRDHPNPDYEEARSTFRRLGGRSGRTARSPDDTAAMAKARSVVADFNRLPKPELTGELRRAMLEETELTFAHILKEDRSVLELLESDYTFLNEDLAKHYGVAGITGRTLRKVALPPDSPRGGVLTQGTVLAVTSNPTRTSPVKRGVFILDTILGTPTPPPPPNIPSLEEAAPADQLRKMNLRETLALHARDPMCASCHNRMDPLGLALENFNAMGAWRDADLGQPISAAGKLITGETFRDVRELKHLLVTSRRSDFYYALSEKLLTYALGRGLDYYDVPAVDRLVAGLESSGGRLGGLLQDIVNSVPFQQRRQPAALASAVPPAKAAPTE